MRIAILADIHGNLPAFEAALEHVAHQSVDQILIAGDIVNGAPDSLACWELALSLGCPILRGNHERYVFHFNTPQAAPVWSTPQYAPLHWTHAQIPESARQQMAALPLTLRLPEAPDLLVVHASERDDYDTVAAYTPDAEVDEMFPAAPERCIVRAHNHIGQVRLRSRGVIITAGSVGIPLDCNPTAQYLLLERQNGAWRAAHQSVPYALERVERRFKETGYLEATGPIGQLYLREILTGTHQMLPFLRFHAQWSQSAPLSLEDSLRRFLDAL